MTQGFTSTARLVFAARSIVVVDEIQQIMRDALTHNDFSVAGCDMTDTAALSFATSGGDWEARIHHEGDEVVLHVTAPREDAALLTPLAHVAFALVEALPVAHVIWAGTELRLPRERFLAQLAPACAAQQPVQAAEPERLRPRRVKLEHGQARTQRLSQKDVLARTLPVAKKARRQPTAQTKRTEAHYQAYDRRLRSALVAPVQKIEMADLPREQPEAAEPASVSSWALSVGVATISLPLAVPLLAYNATSAFPQQRRMLATGIAGLFVALDATGVAAGLLGSY
ncbi:hypothetical protein KUV62_18400 [Salipiger bermudensis]|uniref:hypothetical protein n=1 Tax=Salipiger bermudensis TaxID=344736 RepID=UPI001C99C8BA|nr:hypothetical protein [Salipiger bermudensis]MBY6005898.1 hypothetical protein [Salipiger bermudensis]